MQAMLLRGSNEQFDIADAEAVNAIYNHIDNAVESIKVIKSQFNESEPFIFAD